MLQEELWEGGNQNEFIVMIGINDKEEVTWSRVISFTDRTELRVKTKEYVEAMETINLVDLSLFLFKELDNNFKRKPFEEFGKLTIAPPSWAIILAYVLTLLACLFISLWIVNNEFENEKEKAKLLIFFSGIWIPFLIVLEQIKVLIRCYRMIIKNYTNE